MHQALPGIQLATPPTHCTSSCTPWTTCGTQQSPSRSGQAQTLALLATGCEYHPNSADAPYTCLRKRTGFTKSTPAADWQGLYSVKETMPVSQFTNKMIELHRLEANASLPEPRTVATMRVTWSDSSAGLRIRVQFRLGLMVANSTTTFDTTPLAAFSKSFYDCDRYLKNATNVANKNMTQVGYPTVRPAIWHAIVCH